LSNQSIIEQCQSIGLSLEDLKIAKTIQILIKENAHSIASGFFKGMSHIPGYARIIQEYSNEERWINIHAHFLVLMFAGEFNDAHINKLTQVAKNH
jgi:heam-based aerotactic trancducer